MTSSSAIETERSVVRLNFWAQNFYRAQLARSRWGCSFLRERGVSPAQVSSWQIGYAPAGRRTLVEHLQRRGAHPVAIEEAGLAIRDGDGVLIDLFRDRLMLAFHASTGAVIGFIGRARDPISASSRPAPPKYLNTPETRLFHKGEVLFGLDEGRHRLRRGAHPVIVEGPFDVMAINLASADHVGVAPCGTQLTPAHLAALTHAAPLEDCGLSMAFDGDRAGREALLRSYTQVFAAVPAATALAFPDDSDPAAFGAQYGPKALAAFLRRPVALADLVLDLTLRILTARSQPSNLRPPYPEERLAVLRGAVAVIATLPSHQVAQQVARLSQALNVDHHLVTEALINTSAHRSWEPFPLPKARLPAPRRSPPPMPQQLFPTRRPPSRRSLHRGRPPTRRRPRLPLGAYPQPSTTFVSFRTRHRSIDDAIFHRLPWVCHVVSGRHARAVAASTGNRQRDGHRPPVRCDVLAVGSLAKRMAGGSSRL
ncbi:toprim domain-containing protein [Streptosporangium lutulentum]|nr:toprim domain-containing protein [Streptosporangium lutulentum]